MATTYYTILTNAGIALEVAANASGTQFTLSQMAVGDGGGNPTTPDPAQVGLVREVYRATLNSVGPDVNNPGQFVAELVIPSSVGGFTIREAGLYTSDGIFFAVANTPAVYKPSSTEGAYGDTVLKMTFKIANADTINLVVDPNISVATRTWVENYAVPANIIPGGLTGQVLAKDSNTDGDVSWKDASAAVEVLVDTIEEDQTLAASQTAVILSTVTTNALAVYIEGTRLRESEWTAVDETHLTLAQSYEAGTHATFVQNEQTGYNNVMRGVNNLSEVSNQDQSFANIGGQTGRTNYSVDNSSTVNAVIAQFTPAITAPTEGMVLRVKIKNANTGASTFQCDGVTPRPIVGGNLAALKGGELVAGGETELMWSNTIASWVILAQAGGARQVAPATQADHALQLGQATGRFLKRTVITSSLTFVPRTDTKRLVVRGCSGGGAGGSVPAETSPTVAVGSGGASGAHCEATFVSFPASIAVTVGAGGTPNAGNQGGPSGSCTFGSLILIPGAGGGPVIQGANNISFYAGQGNPAGMPVIAGAESSFASGGQPGPQGVSNNGVFASGQGAPSPFGGGGTNTNIGTGGNGTGYGAGGAGAATNGSAFLGGPGAPGIFIVDEYA